MFRSLLFSLLTLPFLICSSFAGKAQGAVYYCPEMGAIGYAYSNDDNGNDIKALKRDAEKSCQAHGGNSCALLYETSHLGWGGIVRGADVMGNPVVIATGGFKTEAHVRDELRREYLLAGGMDYNQVLVITWQAE